MYKERLHPRLWTIVYKRPFINLFFLFYTCYLGRHSSSIQFFWKTYLFWCEWEAGLYLLVFVGFFTSIISVYYHLKIVKLFIIKESEEMIVYILTYVSSPLPSLLKSSIKVGLIVCVIVSTSLGVLLILYIILLQITGTTFIWHHIELIGPTNKIWDSFYIIKIWKPWWWNVRHAILKILCYKVWKFESFLRHSCGGTNNNPMLKMERK